MNLFVFVMNDYCPTRACVCLCNNKEDGQAHGKQANTHKGPGLDWSSRSVSALSPLTEEHSCIVGQQNNHDRPAVLSARTPRHVIFSARTPRHVIFSARHDNKAVSSEFFITVTGL